MKKHIIAMLMTGIFVVACGSESHSPSTATQQAAPRASTDSATPTAYTVLPESNETAQYNASSPTALTTHALPTHRPFVITADLTFRTDDVRKTTVAIEQLALQNGGFTVSNQTYTHIISKESFAQTGGMLLNIERYESSVNLIVRIPREKSQVFLHAIQPHITLLEQQNYVADDVFARLQREVLTAQREQDKAKALQQLNAKAKTADHSDRERTLENQFIAREREDEAQIQQAELKDKVDYATINLHFRQPEQIMKYTTINGKALAAQQRPPIWASIQQAFAFSLNALFELFLIVLKTWFVWVSLVAFLLIHKRKKQSPKDK